MHDDDADTDTERERPVEQCIARQSWPLRSLETSGQPTQGTDK